MQYEIFNKELETIINDDIREFAKVLLDNAPSYFFEKPSSSSGKYHAAYAQGKGGLTRHTKAVVRLLNYILELEQFTFPERMQDLMRVACLYHDAEKYGKEGGVHTVFDHPLVASKTVRSYSGQYLLEEEIELIAGMVDTHMGSFNTSKRSKVVLPKPSTSAQKIVHLADCLSSKKDIEILFDESEAPEPPTLENYIMPFGKYKGEPLLDKVKKDRGYFQWLLSDTDVREPTKGFIIKGLKGEQT